MSQVVTVDNDKELRTEEVIKEGRTVYRLERIYPKQPDEARCKKALEIALAVVKNSNAS